MKPKRKSAGKQKTRRQKKTRATLLVLGQRLLKDGERRGCMRAVRKIVRVAELGDVEVGLTFVHDLEMRALNRAWRKKDEPTDVLSFAAQEGEALTGAEHVLGDLVVSVDTARRQARRLGHSLELEIAALVAHGLCHLGGLDHERSRAEAALQLACEQTLLGAAKFDIAAALAGRV